MSFNHGKIILKTYSGSIAYGTNTPQSDVDIRGICIPSEQYLLGLKKFEQYEDPYADTVIYSLEKYIQLAIKSNPNIVEMLFVDDDMILEIDDIGMELRKMRNEFLTKGIFNSYAGYANAQFRRMTSIDKNATGKRAELVQKYGYDTKNAMHLIRLMNQCKEIMDTGNLTVKNEATIPLLMDIRNGKYSLDEITEMNCILYDQMLESFKVTSLPDKVDIEKVDNWLIQSQKKVLIT